MAVSFASTHPDHPKSGHDPIRSLPLSGIHRFHLTLRDSVPLSEARGTLELARLAVEALVGPGRTALEAHCSVQGMRFSFDTSTETGRTFALIFLGYTQREFG